MGSLHHEPPDFVARQRLRSFVERAERLNAEIKGLNDDKALVFAEAKASGFDVKVLKTVIKRRKLDVGERDELDALLETYERALEGRGESSHAHVHVHARVEPEPPDDPPSPRGGEINGPQLVALDCLAEDGAYVRSDNAGTVVHIGFPNGSGTGNGILLNAAEWSEIVALGLVERIADGGWRLTRKGYRWRAELRRSESLLASVADDEETGGEPQDDAATDDRLPEAAGEPPPEPAPTRAEQDAADSMAAYERVQRPKRSRKKPATAEDTSGEPPAPASEASWPKSGVSPAAWIALRKMAEGTKAFPNQGGGLTVDARSIVAVIERAQWDSLVASGILTPDGTLTESGQKLLGEMVVEDPPIELLEKAIENGHDTRSAGEHLAEDRPHPDDPPEDPPPAAAPSPPEEIRAVTIWPNEKLRTRLGELRQARNLSADRSPEVLADYDTQIALIEGELRGRGHTIAAAPPEDPGAEIDPRTVDEAVYADMPPPERKAFREQAEVLRREAKGRKSSEAISYAAIEVIETAVGWIWNEQLEFFGAPALPCHRGPFPRSSFSKPFPSREAAIAAAAKEIEESLHPVVDKKSSPASAAQRKEASNIILWAAGLRSMYGRTEMREAAGNKPTAAGVFP